MTFQDVFKKSFMSPAAYYLESESVEFQNFSSQINSTFFATANNTPCDIKTDFRFELEGEKYAQLSPLLNNLTFSTVFLDTGRGTSSLHLQAAYDDEVFFEFLSNIVEKYLTVYFPEMTNGKISSTLSDQLQNVFKRSNNSIQEITGYTHQELTEWIGTLLQPILLDALNNSEQELGFAVVDGKETSTVTFTIKAQNLKNILRQLATALQRDKKLPLILKNILTFTYSVNEFRKDFLGEFDLTSADLEHLPLIEKIYFNSPNHETNLKNNLLHFINLAPDDNKILDFIDNFSDEILDFSESTAFPDGLSLTAFYQGTKLVGRSLKLQTLTLFECFNYQTNTSRTLDCSFIFNNKSYRLILSELLHSDKKDIEISLSRLTNETDYLQSSNANNESTSKEIFSINALIYNDKSVGGVATFLGNIQLKVNDNIYSFAHEKIRDNESRLYLEKRTFSQDKLIDKARILGKLVFSNKPSTDNIQTDKTSDFGSAAFLEFCNSLKNSLYKKSLYNVFFSKEDPLPSINPTIS